MEQLAGGAYGNGAVYAVNTDGTGSTNLYSFSAAEKKARGQSKSSLVLSGGTLYGTTTGGGTYGNGAVFAIHTDGTGYTNFYSFNTGTDDGLIRLRACLSGSTLMERRERAAVAATGRYSTSTPMARVTPTFTFQRAGEGTNNDGAAPLAALIVSGGRFMEQQIRADSEVPERCLP